MDVAATVGEYIDRLMTVEMRPGSGNLPRGVIHHLYEAARKQFSEPLVLSMAGALNERVQPGDRVVILTGAGAPPDLPKAEVDGLLGAVAIARALHFGLEAEVSIMTEERAMEPLRAAVHAASMNFRIAGADAMSHAVEFEATPVGHDASKEHATEVLDRLQPTAIIGIEKLAPNRVGVIHGATGLNYDSVHTDPAPYFEYAQSRGILTCGIGDGGNEVGFGCIRDAAAAIMPAGNECLCDCRGGSASSVATDEFVVAAISDWGGYALAAMLGYLLRSPHLIVGADEVERMLLATVNAGAFDGAIARPTLSDDGVPLRGQRAFADLLHTLVEIALSDLSSPGH